MVSPSVQSPGQTWSVAAGNININKLSWLVADFGLVVAGGNEKGGVLCAVWHMYLPPSELDAMMPTEFGLRLTSSIVFQANLDVPH